MECLNKVASGGLSQSAGRIGGVPVGPGEGVSGSDSLAAVHNAGRNLSKVQ